MNAQDTVTSLHETSAWRCNRPGGFTAHTGRSRRFGLYLGCVVRMKAKFHVGDTLRVGGGTEYFPLVVFKRLDP